MERLETEGKKIHGTSRDGKNKNMMVTLEKKMFKPEKNYSWKEKKFEHLKFSID